MPSGIYNISLHKMKHNAASIMIIEELNRKMFNGIVFLMRFNTVQTFCKWSFHKGS